MSLAYSTNRILPLLVLCVSRHPERFLLHASLCKIVAPFPYLWAGHLILNIIWHVGRVAMHRHVHGNIDTHAGEHVMLLFGRLSPGCISGTEHSGLVLNPRAVLRDSVAASRRHHLQPVDNIDPRNCTFLAMFLY